MDVVVEEGDLKNGYELTITFCVFLLCFALHVDFEIFLGFVVCVVLCACGGHGGFVDG